jgi:toxin ParE1/3/4
MKRVIKNDLALQDLDEQAAFIEADNPDAAIRFLDAANNTFAFLLRTPRAGRAWESSNPTLKELRVWRVRDFEKHLIFYRPTEDGIQVVRVLHASRDIERLFAGRE